MCVWVCVVIAGTFSLFVWGEAREAERTRSFFPAFDLLVSPSRLVLGRQSRKPETEASNGGKGKKKKKRKGKNGETQARRTGSWCGPLSFPLFFLLASLSLALVHKGDHPIGGWFVVFFLFRSAVFFFVGRRVRAASPRDGRINAFFPHRSILSSARLIVFSFGLYSFSFFLFFFFASGFWSGAARRRADEREKNRKGGEREREDRKARLGGGERASFAGQVSPLVR